MKKTCMNCTHYHGCLAEEEPSFYHIHDYCDAWDRTNTCPMYSFINSFLEDYDTSGYAICDDNEIGASSCYRFTEGNEDNTEWCKKNFEHNRKAALEVLDKIINEHKCYNRILDKEEKLSDEELEYFRDLRYQIKQLEFDE